MTFPPRPSDLPLQELAALMERQIALGWVCFVKWTCPQCGDRCNADEPNVIHGSGYRHTERADGRPCGGLYDGPRFGLMVVRRGDVAEPPNNPLDA